MNGFYYKNNDKSKWFNNELLFNLYFWGFVFLKPFLQKIENSTLLLFSYSILILIISFIKSNIRNQLFLFKIVFIVFFVLSIDSLFRYNLFITKYAYEFVIFGAIPIYLLLNIQSVHRLLKIYVIFSLLIFVLFFHDPLNNYAIFKGYMSYGFEFALPTFFGLHIGRRFYNYKWILPVEFISFIFLILFSNRSVILSVIVFLLFINIYYTRNYKIKLFNIFVILLLLGVGIYYSEIIFSFIFNKTMEYGYYSFTARRLEVGLGHIDFEDLLSGRYYLWTNALKDIKGSGFFYGRGTGSFQVSYSAYSHNLIIDLLYQYGFLGLLLFSFFIISSFKNSIASKGFYSILGILFFSLWFPKLLFSVYFFRSIGFWLFIALGLSNLRKRLIKLSFDENTSR